MVPNGWKEQEVVAAIQPEYYENSRGFYVKKFLINDQINGNNWRVPWHAVKEHGHKFIGMPTVRNEEGNHPATGTDGFYKVGEITDVYYNDEKREATNTARIDDPRTQKMIEHGEVRYSSVKLQARADCDVMYEKDCDTFYEFRPVHDALVKTPAYGKANAKIRSTCKGTKNSCDMEMKADMNDENINQATIVDWAKRKKMGKINPEAMKRKYVMAQIKAKQAYLLAEILRAGTDSLKTVRQHYGLKVKR